VAKWPVPEVCDTNAVYLCTVYCTSKQFASFRNANPTDIYVYKDATNHSLILADEWTTEQNTYGSIPLDVFLLNFDTSVFCPAPKYFFDILTLLIKKGVVKRRRNKLSIVG
jgi:hypothetical protein